MSVSARKKTSSRSKKGRSHQALTEPKLIKCPKCKKPTLPHQVCLFCGTYQGRQVIKVETDKKKGKKEKK